MILLRIRKPCFFEEFSDQCRFSEVALNASLCPICAAVVVVDVVAYVVVVVAAAAAVVPPPPKF